ncbi:diguanylate cyclase [Nocardioides mesophilus]|uniref:Diguanylate cyclase n=1 Tax=Nocardioides mesophilus TaxID=433659 RepID=A0A7G9RFS9_9ACTN|nr:diguanylate cyclase [Nocardioides mesophilus]QNN54454.1 diguanylate cyclase [Nocardioides mesophilus]
MAQHGTRGLVQELLRSQRLTLLMVLAMLLLSLLTSGYLLLVSQPHVERYLRIGYQARVLQLGMLDQETGLRGWLATGEREFLAPYIDGRGNADAAEERLLREIDGEAEAGITDQVVKVLLARADFERWAARAADVVPAEQSRSELVDFLREGKASFDAYRAADARSTSLILDRRAAAVAAQRTALVTVMFCYLFVLIGTGLLALRRRRQLQDDVVVPVDRLLDTIAALNDGDLTARARVSGVREIDAIGSALGELAENLGQARSEAGAREERLELLASRFETVVRVAREISGSLSVRYVSISVTEAAADLLGSATLLWVRDEHQQFVISSRSDDPHGAVPPSGIAVPAVVAAAAAEARPTTLDQARAYPLVLAGMVVGVLQTEVTVVDDDTEAVLEALLSTASAALESAKLHSEARELAHLDGLTQLPNRRRFEADIDDEWQRCRRYGRPLSLVMVDLDHFKTLNDTHGHLFGDEVLRAVAAALSSALRTSDTAYRYGGEEFAVLLRETGLVDAEPVAERIRAAIAAVTIPETGVMVSASAGVAERIGAMAHHTEMVAKADAALYAAKHAGRDRVMSALPGR